MISRDIQRSRVAEIVRGMIAVGIVNWYRESRSMTRHAGFNADKYSKQSSQVETGSTNPGGKIIDCGPVGPLMMDLSSSCWEGLSPSHFKGPERVIRRLEPLHCQWTKFITLQRAWSSSYWKGLSPSHIDGPKRAMRGTYHCQLTVKGLQSTYNSFRFFEVVWTQSFLSGRT